jgi:hypothetical protein
MFIATVIFCSAALLIRGVFAVRSSIGLVCKQSESVGTVTKTATFQFSTSDLCFATGVQLVREQAYRVRMEIVSPWRRGDLTSTGEKDGTRVRSYLAVPFRRLLAEPWFKPFARIGAIGADEYPLDKVDDLGLDNPASETRITARTSGELFFFVNDVLPLPLIGDFHNNDQSTAVVSINQIGK